MAQINYEIVDFINGDEFTVTAFKGNDKDLNSTVDIRFHGPGNTVVTSDEPCLVSISPHIGKTYEPGAVLANDLVYPNNPYQVPYYFKYLSSGTVGFHPPIFSGDELPVVRNSSVTLDSTLVDPFPEASDANFGLNTGVSNDGKVLAVGSMFSGTGNYGKVTIFDVDILGNKTIREELYDVQTANIYFGVSITLNGDGTKLVVGNRSTGSFANFGTVITYGWDGTNYIKINELNSSDPNTSAGMRFGKSLSITTDGLTLAVGTLKNATETPAIKIYTWNSGTTSWDFLNEITSTTISQNPNDINSAVLSGDGNYLLCGQQNEDSNGFTNNGACHVFERNGITLTHVTTIYGEFNSERITRCLATNHDGSVFMVSGFTTTAKIYIKDEFGYYYKVSEFLKSDPLAGFGCGMTTANDILEIYLGEHDSANVVDYYKGTLYDNAIKAYSNDFIKIHSDFDGGDTTAQFGIALSYSGNGKLLFVCNGNLNTVNIYGITEAQEYYLKGQIVDVPRKIARSISSNYDGTKIAVGTKEEISIAVNGSVIIYELVNGVYTETGYIPQPDLARKFFGSSLALSEDGNSLITSSFGSPGNGQHGIVYIYSLINGVWTVVQTIDELIETGQQVNAYAHYLTLSGDGQILYINSWQSNFAAAAAGSFYMYRKVDGKFIQATRVDGNPVNYYYLASSIATNYDGSVIICGRYNSGQLEIYERADNTITHSFSYLDPTSPYTTSDQKIPYGIAYNNAIKPTLAVGRINPAGQVDIYSPSEVSDIELVAKIEQPQSFAPVIPV